MNGRRRGNWSVQELERLKELFPRHGVRTTAELLRRSEDSVRRKALELFQAPVQHGGWRDEEDAFLRRCWGAVDPRLLGQILGRPMDEVLRRAANMREKLASGPWQRAEIAGLKEHYGSRTDVDLVVTLRRSREEIVHMAQVLRLAKDKRFARRNRTVESVRMPRWDPSSVALLREIYPVQDNLQVARALNRTVASVANKASQLGLKKCPELLARIGRENVSARHGGRGARGQAGTNGTGRNGRHRPAAEGADDAGGAEA